MSPFCIEALVVSDPVSLARLQQTMRDERFEVLQYLVLEHGVILWHISGDAVHVRNVFLPRVEVIAKVAALRRSLADRNAIFDEATAKELFLYLVQPALGWIKSDHLVIIPHEDLQNLPFQVFEDPTNHRFLGEQFAISYAPSATILNNLRRVSNLASGKILVVANPDFADEAAALKTLFPGRSQVVSRELPSKARVKSWIPGNDIVHLAVHGHFDVSDPLLSFLELGRDGDDDGHLSAAEMFGLPLDQTSLVVLSACESGIVEATHGNEILGMVRALLYAGAKSLVLSYWRVDTIPTSLWMRAFYQAARTRPPSAAARLALQHVKVRYPNPRDWGAFMVIGK
jgi:CHAT domain-containing protein